MFDCKRTHIRWTQLLCHTVQGITSLTHIVNDVQTQRSG
jgi:hypothetical protein